MNGSLFEWGTIKCHLKTWIAFFDCIGTNSDSGCRPRLLPSLPTDCHCPSHSQFPSPGSLLALWPWRRQGKPLTISREKAKQNIEHNKCLGHVCFCLGVGGMLASQQMTFIREFEALKFWTAECWLTDFKVLLATLMDDEQRGNEAELKLNMQFYNIYEMLH